MQFFDDEDFSWRILAVESVVIMLSVLLGFTLNGWRQSASEQETVEAALQSIAAEMSYNANEVENLHPRYRAMHDTLRRLVVSRGSSTPMEVRELTELPGFGGLRVPQLRTSAFETARSTGALANMDFALANDVFSVYRDVQFYSDLIDELTSGLVRNDFQTLGDWLRVYTLLYRNGSFSKVQEYSELMTTLTEEYGIEVKPSADSMRTAR